MKINNLKNVSHNYNIKLNATAANKASINDDIPLRELLSPLPSARQEVEMLAQNFYGYFAFDSLATESTFKTHAPQYGIIHLAMHGLLDRRNPILSGLVFTENSDSAENDFLQAYEISKMNLNANLVVLSACETGFGKFEKGNGTASLARAFMYAGVPAMVVSLWEVNDISTSRIMQVFYNNLSNGMDKAEALRQAKLEYIKSAKGVSAHPTYWSAFVQMGNSQPVETQLIASKGWIWMLAGGALLLLAAFVLPRFKK